MATYFEKWQNEELEYRNVSTFQGAIMAAFLYADGANGELLNRAFPIYFVHDRDAEDFGTSPDHHGVGGGAACEKSPIYDFVVASDDEINWRVEARDKQGQLVKYTSWTMTREKAELLARSLENFNFDLKSVK
jgi:hypothetical protein